MRAEQTKEYNLVSVIEEPTVEAAGLDSAMKLGLLPAALPTALVGAHGETRRPCPLFNVLLVLAVVVLVVRETIPGTAQPCVDRGHGAAVRRSRVRADLLLQAATPPCVRVSVWYAMRM